MKKPKPVMVGDATLFLGDCDILIPLLASKDIAAVLTDPPYGIGYEAGDSTQRGIQNFDRIPNDDKPFDPRPFLGFPDVLLWGTDNYCHHIPSTEGQWYVWDKVTQNGVKVRIAEAEFAWHKKGTKSRIFRHLWSGAYRGSEGNKKSVHPTQKPVALMQWCLRQMKLPQGAAILDPFMGSGTTGVACLRMGYKFIGVEIVSKYFKIAIERMRGITKDAGLWEE